MKNGKGRAAALRGAAGPVADAFSMIERLEGRMMLACDGLEQMQAAMTSAAAATAATALAPAVPCAQATGAWDFQLNRQRTAGTLDGHVYVPGQEPRHTVRLSNGLVPVQSVQWSVVGAAGSSGGVTGAQAGSFSLLVESGKHETGLLTTTAAGRQIPLVELVSRDAQGRVYAHWKLEDVTISSFSPHQQSGGADVAVVELDALKITYEYTAYDGAGTATVNRSTWDLGTRKLTGESLGNHAFAVGAEPEYVLELGGTQLEITSWSWGQTRAGLAAQAGTFNFLTPKGFASPGLMGRAVSGRLVPTAVLVGRNGAGEFVRWKLEEVTVGTFAPSDDSGGAATDSFSLNFARLEQTVSERDPLSGTVRARTSKHDYELRRIVSGTVALEGEVFPAGGLPGQTMQVEGRGHIAIDGFAWGGSRTEDGSLSLSDVSVQLEMSMASPGLLLGVAAGRNYRDVVITRRDVQGREVLRWKLDDVVFNSQSVGASAGGGVPSEGTSLSFGRITQTVTEYAADGTARTNEVSYDRGTTKVVGGGFGATDIPVGSEPQHVLEIKSAAGDAQLPVTTYQWGETGSGAGRGVAQDFVVSVATGLASPGFVAALALGSPIASAEIVSRDAQGRVTARWKLSGVIVGTYQIVSPTGGTTPLEQVHFDFEKIELEYTGYDASGNALPVRRAGWDFALGRAITGNASVMGQNYATLPEHTVEFEGAGEIEVKGFSWGDARPYTGGVGAAAQVGDVSISIERGEDSPSVLLGVASGRQYREVVLTSHDAGGTEYLRWRLEDVVLTSYYSDEAGQEHVQLSFAKITQDFNGVLADGTPTAVTGSLVSDKVSDWAVGSGTTGGFGRYEFAPGTEPELMLETMNGQVELSGWSWSEAVTPGGTGVTRGDFVLSARGGLHSIGMATAVVQGRLAPAFRLISRDDGGRVITEWTLEDAVVTSYSTAEAGGDGQPAFETYTVAAAFVRANYFEYCLTDLVVTGTSGNDAIHMTRSGDDLHVFLNSPATGTPTQVVPLATLGTVLVEGHDGDDTIVVDYAGGVPLPARATLKGGNGADAVEIVGSAGDAALAFSQSSAGVGAASFGHERVETVVVRGAAAGSLTLTGEVRVALGLRGGVFRTGALAVSPVAQLDLRDNDLIVDGGDLAGVRGLIASARGGTQRWAGPGLTSSDAAANSLLGLALTQATGVGTFAGQAVDAGDVLVKVTYNGDANLDGRVNSDDYFRIDSGFLAQAASPAYTQGDFNFDNALNSDDYFLIDSAFLGQSGVLGGAGTSAAGTSAAATSDGAEDVRRKGKAVRSSRVAGVLTETVSARGRRVNTSGNRAR